MSLEAQSLTPSPTPFDVAAGYRAPYEVRTLQTFQPGQVVRLGPRYVMGGTYEADGWEGIYVIDTPVGRADYRLRALRASPGRDLVIARCSRLQLHRVPQVAR